jgi:hypothetical protein
MMDTAIGSQICITRFVQLPQPTRPTSTHACAENPALAQLQIVGRLLELALCKLVRAVRYDGVNCRRVCELAFTYQYPRTCIFFKWRILS